MLMEVQRLETSGARAVEPFTHEGVQYLAVPQLAADIPGQPPAMTNGNSDVETIIYRLNGRKFVEHQRLPVPGGEDAEAFVIDGRRFLATASLRSGGGPYELNVESTVYELRDGRLEPFQTFPTFAAKQWKYFALGKRHFLALAQGMRTDESARGVNSIIYEWNGLRFVPFQELPSAWGYNWSYFEVGGHQLLGYADHIDPSRLMRWNGRIFEPFLEFESRSGRAFCFFRANGESWLAFAGLQTESLLYRWHRGEFVIHQALSGPGGREFEWIPANEAGYLLQVNFIRGTREAPHTSLQSHVYAWRDGQLQVVESFTTSGGTDAASFEVGGTRYVAVSNSLDEHVRFRTDTRLYEFLPHDYRSSGSRAVRAPGK